MTYASAARVFEAAVTGGASTEDALRAVDAARNAPRRGPKAIHKDLPGIVDRILHETASRFDLPVTVVAGVNRRRSARICGKARRAAAVVMCLYAGLSYTVTIKALGRTNHTTALWMVEKAHGEPDVLAAAEEIAVTLELAEPGERRVA